MKNKLLPIAVLCASCLICQSGFAQTLNLPPSAELTYKIQAKRNGFSLTGRGQTQWHWAENSYRLQNSARATLLGKIQESSSSGTLEASGLAPHRFTETRFRKEMTTTTFVYEEKKITFSEGSPSMKLLSGTQDRASVVWQLATIARSQPEKLQVGSEWSAFVAGRRDAETWRFKVVGKEMIQTSMGEISSLHLVKAPPADSKEQQVDLWLAPGLEWYPVQIRFKDADGDFVEQTLEKVLRKKD